MSVKIAERLQRVRPYGERRIPLGPGAVWFFNPDLGTGLCFPIQRLGYRVKLSGPAGAVEAFLTFTNPSTEAQDATFLFPLDRNISPVKIQGKCGERQLETGVVPAPMDPTDEQFPSSMPVELCKLFREETENVLAIPLGKIPPGGEVSFKILWAHMVTECGESGLGFSFRMPLLVSRALSTLNTEDMEQTQLASGLDRGAQVAISIQVEASDLQPGQFVTSQTCAIGRNPNGDLTVEYDRRKPLEARDFVLDYQLWTGNRPKAWLRSQGRHFLLNFFPPGTPTPSNPRRLVILVDGSEEMSRIGPKRCLDCLSLLLKNLDPPDRFALVAFNREVSGYKNGDFVEAEFADQALQWMSEYQFSGAADLKELLRRVITLPRQPDSVLSVVLISAGRIGNEAELYRLLQGSRDILRLFPIMLGPKADPHFARAASRLTGGHAFRALAQDSVSRSAERLLEHTRQPVLEGVGFQDKGIQYQGESLTPKYPSGLNGKRPITVMGAHAGRGGLDAGGTGPGGTAWSEHVALKPAFHKVIANVWAHVKSRELDDEAQMLDRAERGILQNVIRNLSREFGLLNRHTASAVRFSDGSELLAPCIEARRWYRLVATEETKGRAASELLEEQKSQKEFKGGMSNKRSARQGLKMKEVLGSKATAAIFGSKLGHRNKLSGSVKEGLFSKPMLKSRKESLSRSGGGTATVAPPKAPPKAPPSVPTAQPVPPEPSLPDAPTTKLGAAPTIHSPPAIEIADMSTKKMDLPSVNPMEPEPQRPQIRRPGQDNGTGPTGPPRIGQNPMASFSPEPASTEKVLPTPRELAAKVSAEARQGKPDEVARNALKASPDIRQQLMTEMRLLHGKLGELQDVAKLTELTDAVLFGLAEVAPKSELLVRAYGLGYQGRNLLESDLNEAKQKLKFWLGRFAKLF